MKTVSTSRALTTLGLGIALSIQSHAAAQDRAEAAVTAMPSWQILDTEPYPGKQDDIFFVSPQIGWYANGAGKIFRTDDGGVSWRQQVHMPGTYFRCLTFLDDLNGFAGNIGPGYFPNVADETPLYRTRDGGETWEPVTTIEGEPIIGLCSLSVVREQYINAGVLDQTVRIIGVGRVGGPTAMIVSDDLGETWQQIDLSDATAMAFDAHFFDRNHGIIAGATSTNVAESRARIIRTENGGRTWESVYESSRSFELTWKVSFPTSETGYVTVQSYNPDPSNSRRFIAKTIDGGRSWYEIPLIDDHPVRPFGIAFLDERRGWVGAVPHGFQTTDGGETWSRVDFGNAVNKIRVLREGDDVHAFAIGVNVAKTVVPAE